MADNTFDWPEELPEPDFVMFPKVYFRAIFPHLTPVERSVFELLMFAAYEYGRGVADRSVRDLIAGRTGARTPDRGGASDGQARRHGRQPLPGAYLQ
jgi:hypothetical protein